MQRVLTLATCLLLAQTAVAERPVFMFVQVADSGSLVPRKDSPGHYVLTLNGVAPQTVYFSDRPLRNAGHIATGSFLKTLGFSDQNPPNAAVEVAQAAEDEDTIVVELRHPVYDAAKSTLQYDITILSEAKGGLAFYDKRRDMKLPQNFASVSLFIDDCPQKQMQCWRTSGGTACGPPFRVDQCFYSDPRGGGACMPCVNNPVQICTQAGFPGCLSAEYPRQ